MGLAKDMHTASIAKALLTHTIEYLQKAKAGAMTGRT